MMTKHRSHGRLNSHHFQEMSDIISEEDSIAKDNQAEKMKNAMKSRGENKSLNEAIEVKNYNTPENVSPIKNTPTNKLKIIDEKI